MSPSSPTAPLGPHKVRPFVIGVDAGNTKTVALVASTEGQVLGWGRAGAGDIYGSEEGAVREVRHAVDTALERAALDLADIGSSCFSLVGVDWPEDFAFWRRELATWGFAHPPEVVNDALGALRSGSPQPFGVVVACGTGAAVGAQGVAGERWHSSFWQLTGGGFELGERTLRAVYLSELGLLPPTSLTTRVLAHFDLDTAEVLLHAFTSRGGPRPGRPSELAPLLLDEAAHDPVARNIAAEHGAALGDYALVATRKVALEGRFPLVLTGGVFRHPSAVLRDALAGCVRSKRPEAEIVRAPAEPVIGAALLALEALNAVTPEVRQALHDTAPPQTFFATAAPELA